MAPTLEETKTRPIRTTSIRQIGVISEARLPVLSRHSVYTATAGQALGVKFDLYTASAGQAQGVKFDLYTASAGQAQGVKLDRELHSSNRTM